MSLDAFNNIVTMLKPSLTINSNKNHTNECVHPHLIVAIAIRWLCNEQYLDIKNVYGISS